MLRPIRFFIPGNVWHLTHRCHNRGFLLDYAFYRKLWMKWLYEGTHRYDVPILNFMVTSNHIHLLVFASNDMEALPRLMQLVAGRTGQEFNQRRNRKGAYWEKRYSATAVQTGEHLIRCLLYIDLNMVRAGGVKHPKEWENSGYHELAKAKQRYCTIKRSKVIELLEADEQDFGKLYRGWLKGAIRKGNLSRDDVWSSEVAIGDLSFVERVKKRLGLFVSRPENRQHSLNE